jgi:alpha-beta hydrolase superfamily lysophospholipase
VALLSGARGDSLVRDNAVRILAEVETLFKTTHQPVVLVGHSKGGLDAIAALSMYSHRLQGKVAGVVSTSILA